MELRMGPQGQRWSPKFEWALDGYTLRLYQPFDSPHQAPVVFLLHGLEEDWDVWLNVCRSLSNQFCPLCLELPWNGSNGHRWGDTRPAAEWLRQALLLSPIVPTALVGHSLGANAVLEYLHHYQAPELQAVVLMSPFYCSRYEEFDWNLFDRSRKIFREIMQESLVARQGAKKVDPLLLSAMVDKVHEFVGPLGFLEFLSLFMQTPALQLDRIQIPTLVIGGVHDPGSTPASNAALARALPQGRLELLDDCGHFGMLTHPQGVAQSLCRFISESVIAPAYNQNRIAVASALL